MGAALAKGGRAEPLEPSMRLRISCPSAGEQVAAAWQQQTSVTDKTILCAGHHLPTAGCRCTQVSTACLYMFWHIWLVHCMKLGMPANMIGLLGLLAGLEKVQVWCVSTCADAYHKNAASVPLATDLQPASHQTASWLSVHRQHHPCGSSAGAQAVPQLCCSFGPTATFTPRMSTQSSPCARRGRE